MSLTIEVSRLSLLNVRYCCGCENDFYNGKNDLGVQQCWSRDGAIFGTYRLVPIDLPPPYKSLKLQKLPTCYRRKRHVKVKPEALDTRGFWKR